MNKVNYSADRQLLTAYEVIRNVRDCYKDATTTPCFQEVLKDCYEVLMEESYLYAYIREYRDLSESAFTSQQIEFVIDKIFASFDEFCVFNTTTFNVVSKTFQTIKLNNAWDITSNVLSQALIGTEVYDLYTYHSVINGTSIDIKIEENKDEVKRFVKHLYETILVYYDEYTTESVDTIKFTDETN